MVMRYDWLLQKAAMKVLAEKMGNLQLNSSYAGPYFTNGAVIQDIFPHDFEIYLKFQAQIHMLEPDL